MRCCLVMVRQLRLFEKEVSVDDKRDDLKRSSASEVDDPHVGKRSRTYLFTPGCPSCETGMNAPGMRHSAACKRRQTAEFSIPVEEPAGPPVFQPQPVVLPDAESQKSEALSRKRSTWRCGKPKIFGFTNSPFFKG